MSRPVDTFPKPSTWKYAIKQALRLGRCARCGRPPRRFADPVSRAEYQLSAMCQPCQDEFYSAED